MYLLSTNFFKEIYVLTNQITLQEVETQLYLSFDLGYVSEMELKNILEKVVSNKKLLNGFINYYKKL